MTPDISANSFDNTDTYSYDCNYESDESQELETIEFSMDSDFISLLEVYGDPEEMMNAELVERTADESHVFKNIRRRLHHQKPFLDALTLKLEEEALDEEALELKEMNEITYEGRTVAELVADPEIRRSLKNQIVLVLHAHRCMQGEEDSQSSSTETEDGCNFENCSTMKGVLNHMYECDVRKNCVFKYCSSSRLLIEHWINCSKKGCTICGPLKSLRGLPVPDIPHLSEPSSPEDQIPPMDEEQLDDDEREKEADKPKRRGMYLIPNGQRRWCHVPGDKKRLADLEPEDLPKPRRIATEDDFQLKLTDLIRNGYILKIAKMFLRAEESDEIDHNLRGLLTIAKSVELLSYGESENLDEYYHMLGKHTVENIARLENRRSNRQTKKIAYTELMIELYKSMIIGDHDLRPRKAQ